MEFLPNLVDNPSGGQPRTKQSWTDLTKFDGPEGRDDCQFGWHVWIGQVFRSSAILDVGAGLGLSRERLAAGGNTVVLQDLAPGMSFDIHDDIGTLERRSFDVVTAFDVIEHVLDDRSFLAGLSRVARRAVVITTPNYDVSHAANPYHVREYSPPEFLELLAGYVTVLLLAGDSNGTQPIALSPPEFAKHTFPHQAAILDVSGAG